MNYIYVLIDPTSNEIRYVGKSINPSVRVRKHLSEARNLKVNNHRINWIKGLLNKNMKPKMVVIDSVDGDWEWLEQYWISQMKAWGFNLVNGTDGGENPPSWLGKTHTDKHKETLRKRMSSDLNPAKGGLSDEWKKNIGDSLIDHMPRITELAREKNNKPVIQYDLDGNFIAEYESLNQATKSMNLKQCSGISECLRGNRQKAGNYQWRYKNNEIIKNIGKVRKSKTGLSGKLIGQFNLDNELLKSWDNAREAANHVGLKSGSSVLNAINSENRTAGGYKWKYIK